MHGFNRLPFDLAMMLTDHPHASVYFSSLPQSEQKEVMSRAHEMGTATQMYSYLQKLCRHCDNQEGSSDAKKEIR